MNRNACAKSSITIQSFVFEGGRSGRGKMLLPIDKYRGKWKGDVMEGGLRIAVDGKTILREQESIEITVLWSSIEDDWIECILAGRDYYWQYVDVLELKVSIKCSGDKCNLGFQYDEQMIANASLRRGELALALIEEGKHFWSTVRIWSISSWMNGRAERALIALSKLAERLS
ncbi:MAG: hypothetical protein AABZ53_11855 [Planctomycetota bacterium]